ncbi:hypothetical protein HY488_01750 [Candidatus Woesearchaeota archaeon]|nr:hypothetical protein [Candidatus Woesearchaeota archaeon]
MHDTILTMNQKAQMQMAETIAILLVFFVIIGLSLTYYGAFQAGSIREAQREQFEKEAIRIALVVSHLPEVACSDDNQITENCFDKLKVQSLSTLAAQGGNEEAFLFYQSEFRDSKVVIQQIFPDVEEFVIYDNAPAEFTEMIPTFIPMTIRDPTKHLQFQNTLGLLTVEVYR